VSHLLATSKIQSAGHWASPLTWVKIVGSVWFHPLWYRTKVEPQLTNKKQIISCLAQAVLGVFLIGLIGYVLTWAVIQSAGNVVPLEDRYFLDPVKIFLVLLFPPLVFGLSGFMQKQPAMSVPYAASAVGMSVAFFLATLASLVTLLVARFDFGQSLYSRTFAVGIETVWAAGVGVPIGLYWIQYDKIETKSWQRTRRFGHIKWIVLFGLLWVLVICVHGSLAVFRNMDFNWTTANLISWVLPFVEYFCGYLLGMSLAVRFSMCTQHGVQPTRPAAKVRRQF